LVVFNKKNQNIVMLEAARDSVNYKEMIEKVIKSVEKQGYKEIKADHEDYEMPHLLVNQSTDIAFTPDVSAKKNEGQAYFEIATKEKDTIQLINKWKLLETLAHMKKGSFQLFVPHGHMKFAQDMIEAHKINAKLVKI